MAVETLNTLEDQSINNGLDLENLNDPTDALGIFDMQQMQQNESNPADPPAKKKPATIVDLKQRSDMQRQWLKGLTQDGGIAKLANESRNQFQAARVAEFDAKKLNVDRYLGYGKETFNKVGFSPFVDNEKNFNQNTTIWQDFARMKSIWGGLAYEGGVSGYRSLAGMMKGDKFFTPDDETAENFARLQAIGMSTKEGGLTGAGAWVNNFVLNSAYTIGIGVSILAEEAALFAATAITKGATSGFTAARTTYNAARFGRAIKQAYNTKAVGNIASGGWQLAKSLSKVGDAKNFYTAVKTGGYTLGKGIVQFVNPLTRTTDDIIDIAKGSSSIRNMSNLAKAKQTFGSFYRDVRDANLALSESKLEGGSAKLDKINELIDKHEKEYGKPPEGADLERIYQQAEDTGYGVTAINFPTIYLTNRVVLDGLMKFRGFKTLDEAAELATKGIGFKKGVGYFDALADGWLKNTKRTLLNPKAYVGMGVGYFRRNFAEGIQENLQNVTSDAVSAYYDGVYKDPTLGGLDFAAGNAWNALTYEFSSARGFDTFASGFLMGGFMGRVQNTFLKDVPQVYYWTKDKIAGTNKLQEYKDTRKKTKQDAINGLNELYNNPLKYFSSRNESAVVQKHTSDVMNQAEVEGDAKTFQDAKDLKTFDHVFTALDNGTFEGLINNYKELSKLDSKELANFLGIPESSKASEKLQEIVSRAEQIKDRYDVISKDFKNPFTPNKLKRGTPEFTQEAIAYRAFESAKKTAIYSQYNFDRALERMNGLYSDLASNRPVSKASSSDITVLTDLNTLDSEISLLDKEVKSLEGVTDADQKKMVEQKMNRLDRLMDYRDKLRVHLEKASKAETEENGQIRMQFDQDAVDPLKESYKAYLRQIAEVNNDYMFDDKVDESFTKLLDYYNLDNNARNYNQIVNNLLDPGNLFKHAERLNAKFTELFENKNADIAVRVERGQRVVEMSEFLKAVAAQGVMLDPDELQEFIRTGKKPTTFIDAATLKDLDPSSPKYAAVQAILEIDDAIKETPVTQPAAQTTTTQTTETTTQATTAATTSTGQPNITADIDTELQLKLEDAYNQYIEESGSDMTFAEFVRISPRAAKIKAQFNKTKTQPTATQAATKVDRKQIHADFNKETGLNTILVGSVARGEDKDGSDIDIILPGMPHSNKEKLTSKEVKENSNYAYDTLKDLALQGILTEFELKPDGFGLVFKYKGQEFQVVPNPSAKASKRATSAESTTSLADKKADIEKQLLGSFANTTERVVKSKGPSNSRTIRTELTSEITSDGEVIIYKSKNTYTDTESSVITSPASMTIEEFKKHFYPMLTADAIEMFEEMLEVYKKEGWNGKIFFKELRVGSSKAANYLKGQVNLDIQIGIGNDFIFTLTKKLNDAELAALEGAKPVSNIESKIKNLFNYTERGQISLAGEDYDLINAVRNNPTDENVKKFLELYKSELGKYEQSITDEVDAELQALEKQSTITTAGVLQPNTTPVATATGTSRTEPVVTQTSVSNIEAKKIIIKNAIEAVKESGGAGAVPYTPINPTDDQLNTIVQTGIDSNNKIRTSVLQSVFKIGYNRANAIADIINKELAALEGQPATTQTATANEVTPSQETQTPAEKTGSQKAQELIDSIDSIKNLPDLSRADSGPVTIDLIELISTGKAKAKDIIGMINTKRKELLKNISPKDLQKGDIVTFVDGRKGFVKSVNNNEVTVKIAGSQQGVTENIASKDLSQKISNIESGKLVSMEPTPDIEVTPQEQKEVQTSQDTKSTFTENTSAVKEVGENAAKAAGTDNLQNLNNLLQNIGCKTK